MVMQFYKYCALQILQSFKVFTITITCKKIKFSIVSYNIHKQIHSQNKKIIIKIEDSQESELILKFFQF